MSGQHGGVRAKVKALCPYALFIHCYAHRLNLVLAQGSKDIQDAKLFVAGLESFHNLFTKSAKLTALLTEAGGARVPGGSATPWHFKSRAVSAMYEGRDTLTTVFDQIMTERGWYNDSINQSKSLKDKLHDFKFMFLLKVFLNIYHHT